MLLFFSLLTGISPAQTSGENPGMNHFHNLGSSQPGISVFCSILAVYEKGLTMLFFFSLLTGISPAQTGGENPGMNRFHILGSSQQGISAFCSILAVYEKCLTMLLFFSLLTEISPAQTGGENPGMNCFHNLGLSQQGILSFFVQYLLCMKNA